MTAEQILAIGTLFTAVGSVLVAVWTLANSARRDEIKRLEERLACVEHENVELHDEVLLLRQENMWLRLVLANNGIPIPPMPNEKAKTKEANP